MLVAEGSQPAWCSARAPHLYVGLLLVFQIAGQQESLSLRAPKFQGPKYNDHPDTRKRHLAASQGGLCCFQGVSTRRFRTASIIHF